MNTAAQRLAIARKSAFQPPAPLGTCNECKKDLKRYDWESYREYQLAEDGRIHDRTKPNCCESCAEAP